MPDAFLFDTLTGSDKAEIPSLLKKRKDLASVVYYSVTDKTGPDLSAGSPAPVCIFFFYKPASSRIRPMITSIALLCLLDSIARIYCPRS